MAIRMSGLSSGLDTEAIVGALMSAQSLKKTKLTQQKTKLEWKQTKWADLNTKLCKLYNEQVSKMQLQSSYMTKKATVSDASKASVKAGAKAANGSYSLEIRNIATSQYLTGGKINVSSEKDKLVDVDSSLLNKEITITNGDKVTKFAVTSDTTISDFTTALQKAGLNANFDTTQKRFFISSKESGLENAFSITTSGITAEEVSGREEIRNAVSYSTMTDENKAIVDGAMEQLQTSGVGTTEYNEALDSIAKAAYDTRKADMEKAATTYIKTKLYADNYDSYKTKAEESLKANYFNEDGTLKDGKTQEDYDKAVAEKADEDTTSFVNVQINSSDTKLDIEKAAFEGIKEADINALSQVARDKYYANGVSGDVKGMDGVTQDTVKTGLASVVSNYASITDRNTSLSDSALSGLGLADITVAADGTVSVNGNSNWVNDKSDKNAMAFIAASDSEVVLNGATLTSSSSTISANGLEISLTGLTETDKPITFSVSNDVDSVYDSVKSFLKEYNSLLKEMNTLLNAESSKGYEPLTSEQKKEMSDDDIKLWEDKIKNSLLRNDSTLEGIVSSMRNSMMSQVEYNGKKYSLASFGIMTSTDYTEGGQLHIYGDSEDSVYADKDDKLRKALEEDPDAVVNVLTDVFGKLRNTMSEKMAGSKTSSALTFYNDIKMKDDLRDYEDQISDWEDRLASMEDAYYSKFTAMETALAKLQSQQNSLSGLLGG